MSPVIQRLKLRVCQPDGCILRYYFFCIQSKFQLTIPLNYVYSEMVRFCFTP